MPEKKPVKTNELTQTLLELRATFADWDNARRKKVDLAVKALDGTREYVNIEDARQTVEGIASEDNQYKELVLSSQKMLTIHYNELARTDEELAIDRARTERARKKLEAFKEKGLL